MSEAIREKVRKMIDAAAAGGDAILSTSSAEGQPHAVWMGTLSSPESGVVMTLTSPDSCKITNIRANPAVEWMFTDAEKETVVYLRGEAEVVEDVEEIKQAWAGLHDKSRAYFLDYFNTGMGFAVIKTRVRSVTYSRPKENIRVELPMGELV